MSEKSLSFVTEQLLLGLEEMYGQAIIPKLRVLLQEIKSEEPKDDKILQGFFEVIKELEDFPLTSPLEGWIKSEGPKGELKALLEVFNHLSYDNLSNRMSLLLDFFEVKEGRIEDFEKPFVALLNNSELSNDKPYLNFLSQIYQEKNVFPQIKKILKFYDFIYQKPIFDRLRKALEHYLSLNSDLQVWSFLYDQLGEVFIDRLKMMREQFPEAPCHEFISIDQVRRKKWLVEKLEEESWKESLNIDLLYGGYGLQSRLLFNSQQAWKINKINCIDSDPQYQTMSENFNAYEFEGETRRFEYFNEDIMERNFDSSDLIINTSCESVKDFSGWWEKIPNGSWVALQYSEALKGHYTKDQFVSQLACSEVFFTGSLNLEKSLCYMVIGKK
ncbi:MAG: hypothetical protein HRT44_09415 [Bdellovibrionales bacterium]|nr:hypothetical protein [Bdellovibrionales bacterium]NQZ19458.1 hypothetical protein [Bdellovibrionales bacterium]